jgi:sugar (pentulose or hexulose) kinase
VENKKIIAAIDLGTSNIKCAIFSLGSDGLPKLIGSSKKKKQKAYTTQSL